MNFSVEVSIAYTGRDNYRNGEGPGIHSRFTTNNVIEFSEYVADAVTYFKGAVKFQTNVEYVSILVRTYRDHHTIYMELDGSGQVKVTTNQ